MDKGLLWLSFFGFSIVYENIEFVFFFVFEMNWCFYFFIFFVKIIKVNWNVCIKVNLVCKIEEKKGNIKGKLIVNNFLIYFD